MNNTNQGGNVKIYSTFSEALNSNELISLLILEEYEKPVGFTNLMTIFSIWEYWKAIILDDLYIVPGARGKGYGKKFLKFVESFIKVRNPNAMEFYGKGICSDRHGVLCEIRCIDK